MVTAKPKVILVTGASSGLGKSIAIALSKRGHTVYGSSRKWKNGVQMNGFNQLQLDVNDERSTNAALAYLLEAEQGIDVLINNAGVGIQGPAEDVNVALAKAAFDTNFFGMHRTIQAVLPHMRAQGQGRIINISSIAANMGLPYRGFYCAAKAAVDKYSEALTMEMAPWNIRVSCIEPGDFQSNIAASRLRPAEISAAHEEAYTGCMETLQKQMVHSPSPNKIVSKVVSIVESSKPRFLTRVGKPLEKLAVHLRYWLPASVFQSMLKKFSD